MPESSREWYAKTTAAASGATLTGLTMTPFDVIKTRLQTQPPLSSSFSSPLFPKPPPNTCCQRSPADCVRSMHSLAFSASPNSSSSPYLPRQAVSLPRKHVICLWDGNWTRAQRVNGFWDAAWRVWANEGVAGLWKGVGTTLAIAVPSQTAYMLTYDTLLTTLLPTHALSPFAAGVMARTVVSSALSPFELLRTRLQSTPNLPNTPRTLRGTLNDIRAMVHAEGIRSLWRGLASTLWRDVPFSGMYWVGYESGKRELARNGFEGAPASFISGATSGMMAAVITSPFDVLKTRRQASILINANSSNTLTLAVTLVRSEGYRALFAGLTPRLAKIAPACGIMISCYEGFSKYLLR